MSKQTLCEQWQEFTDALEDLGDDMLDSFEWLLSPICEFVIQVIAWDKKTRLRK